MKSNTGAVRLKTHKIGVWWKVKYIRGGGARGSNRCQLVQFPEQSGKLAEVLRQHGSADCPQQQGLNVDEVLDLRLFHEWMNGSNSTPVKRVEKKKREGKSAQSSSGSE